MLNEVEEVSSASSFVKKITGIDNVCERAAVTYCKKHCEYFELIAGKSIETAMTAAIQDEIYKDRRVKGKRHGGRNKWYLNYNF